jgi:Type II secretion system (T2SS), protein N
MPASRSRPRSAEAKPRANSIWPIVAIGLAAVCAVIIAALPASAVARFLPPSVHAEDFSGNIWHGSAGKFSVNARDAGALEWRLHPGALLTLGMAADLHWVKVGFVLDASVRIDRHGYTAREIKGGGPIEDLSDLGIAAGWRGIADVNISELAGDFATPKSASGDVSVSKLSSAQVADGADLGGYDLQLAKGAIEAGNVTAGIADTGGPLEVRAVFRYSANERTGTLTGTLRERPGAPAALHSQLDRIAQIRRRDPEGRIPVDLEFTL